MKITIDSIKKTVLLAGGLFVSVLSVNADDNPTGLTPEMLLPQFTNLTPEAASLGRYGAFQVSEYSGAANISIPLYTVKSGDVSFPITLYYDATGIKVEQDATFVGLGWNLSYGGMISHIICGVDDCNEVPWYEFSQKWWKDQEKKIKKRFSYDIPWFVESSVKPTHELHPTEATEESVKEIELYARMANGNEAPDIYQASFCGHTLSFTIDKRAGTNSNGQYPIIILNNNPRKYKISYTIEENMPAGYGSKNLSFKITDDKGISYCFGAAYIENSLWESKRSSIDSYYLTKIYGPDGENGKSLVTINYKQEYVCFGQNSRPSTKKHQPTAEPISGVDYSAPVETSSIFSNLVSNNPYNVEIACGENGGCYKVYPNSITTRLDTIKFNTSKSGMREDIPQANYISGITIKSINGGAEREINFKYDYFDEESPRGNYSGKRLKLTRVAIDNQTYSFEYDTRNLPSFASYSKDYWGYYNGANPNDDKFVGCTPAYEISNDTIMEVEHLEGSNRLASEKLCNVGMLQKVIYPTGGYTLYEFEANRFNDRYYYPDTSDKITFPSSYKTTDGSLKSLYGQIYLNSGPYDNRRSLTFTAYQTKCDIWIQASLLEATDTLFLTVKKKDSNIPITDPIIYTGGNKNIGETKSFTLTKDSVYIIEAKLATKVNGSSSCANLKVNYDAVYSPITASPTTKDENGGYSIGGGVRVRTIKNYDSNGTYLNGVKYEYSGGKLLSPTVQLETHHVNCKYEKKNNKENIFSNIDFSFHYANIEPSYPYLCSIGVPATVGYDRVVKSEINENGTITYRKTILEFHNDGYDSSRPAYEINTMMQNAFYYYPHNKGHMNGMIKKESVYNSSVLSLSTTYNYKSIRLDTIYITKCLPLHLPQKGIVDKYNIAFFRKYNTWSYLTSKTETQYDKNGKPLTSNTTSFQYNPTNYQLSDLSVTDGTNTSRTLYSYPASNTLRFMQHILSEVDGVETYRNGKFTGGSKYIFKVHKNPQTGASFSVVDSCCSILPNRSRVREMKVISYDDYGNIREYKKKDETPVTIIWSYNHQLPIMEIVGSTYTEVCNKAKNVKDISSLENASSVSETTMSSIHATLRKDLPNALVTAYTYSPWHSVSEIIKPNGDKVKYNYDQYGRLEKTSDINDKILQKYTYNYKKEK